MKNITFFRYGFYIVLFLLVAAITALITITHQNKASNSGFAPPQYGMGFSKFRNSMGFNPRQTAEYNHLLADYQEQTRPLREKLFQEQSAMLRLLSADHPNTAQLDSVSLSAAMLQHQIRQATFQHLKKVDSIADPAQRQQLIRLYKRLLGDMPSDMAPEGRRHRMRRGQRN